MNKCIANKCFDIICHLIVIEPCNPNPCLNGARCIELGINYTCDCGYKCACASLVAGKNCENSKFVFSS